MNSRAIPSSRSARTDPLTRTEAADILARLKATAVIKPMPAAPLTSRRAADSRMAAKQIAALILDQVQRCEDLERAPDAEPEPALPPSITTEGTMEEPIDAQAPALTDAPDDDVALEYLEIARRALDAALRDKTVAAATICERFERLCSDEGKPYDSDLTYRAVAAAIAARHRALEAFAAQVRAFVKPRPNGFRRARRRGKAAGVMTIDPSAVTTTDATRRAEHERTANQGEKLS